MKTRTIIRNVHRKPIGPNIEWNELTEDFKDELEEFVKETVSNMLVTSDGDQDSDSQG